MNITLKTHTVRLQSVSAEALLNDVWWWIWKGNYFPSKNFKSLLSCENNQENKL